MLIHGYYLLLTIEKPADGGDYIEGAVGSPQYINPILAPSNNIDQDLSRIIFSSLFKHDQSGNLQGDLAQTYEVGDFGKVIDIWLKDNALWHDGEKVTADDVLFTIKLIQDPAFKSPLRPTFSGVDVQKIDDYYLRLVLKDPYAPFVASLTFGILPKHLWQNVSASQFPLHGLNLKPVGSGPYAFSEIKKDKEGNIQSITLEVNKKYYDQPGHLETLKFVFFQSQKKLLEALGQGVVEGLNSFSLQLMDSLPDYGLQVYSVKSPRFFAIFLNQTQSTALANKNIRLALNYATNKKEIVDRVIKNQGYELYGPLTQGILGFNENIEKYEFNQQKANELLDEAGWKDSNGDGIREKGDENLALGLVTLDWPELKEAAQLIKEQWSQVGVNVDLAIEDNATLQQTIIRPRQYQALLFGEVSLKEPDLFAFWHSSHKTDPGFNIALYDNPTADKLLIEARQEMSLDNRISKYQEFQRILVKDAPAVFLYSQNYVFAVNKKIKGINLEFLNLPSERFDSINQWHIKTQRVLK